MMDSATSAAASTPSPTEKHDHMKPIESDDEGEFVVFRIIKAYLEGVEVISIRLSNI